MLSFTKSVISVAVLIIASTSTADAKIQVLKAGASASQKCASFSPTFTTSSSLLLNGSFSQYWEQGSNPSLELLASTLPLPILPNGTDLAGIIAGIAPDVDISRDDGYGWNAHTKVSKHGPLGGLPAFCRFGAMIVTSQYTQVYTEVWMPFKYNPNLGLAALNDTDYPTNSTPISLAADGSYLKAPVWYFQANTTTNSTQSNGAGKSGVMKVADDGVGTGDSLGLADDAGTKQASSHSLATMTAPETTGNSSPGGPASTLSWTRFIKSVSPTSGLPTTATIETADPLSTSKTDDTDEESMDYADPLEARKNYACLDCPLSGDLVLGKSSQGWNRRLLMVGNGAFRGAVPWPTMKQSMSRFGFAVVGCNQGHFGPTGSTTWINGTQREDTLLDWASRGTHVSKLLADEVLNAFYGIHKGKKRHSYYAGCSNGGKTALASAQTWPTDFDGILAGCPGINFNRMNVAQLLFQARHRKSTSVGSWFSNKLLAPVHEVILQQCDKLDGLQDGVLQDPTTCKPDLSTPFLCGGNGAYSSSNETCLNTTQIANLQALYEPTSVEGKEVYPAFPYGWESNGASFQGSSPKARFWILANRKEPNYDNTTFNPYTDLTYDAVLQGDVDGAAWTANVVDLSPAINAGTKILLYHGLSDMTISAYATHAYYKAVQKAVAGRISGSLSDSFRLFDVPGMGHCRDGPGAWHFGGITQQDGGNRPLAFDTQHDMMLRLVAWVEKNHELPFQIAAGYQNRTKVLPSGDPDYKPQKNDVVLPTVFEDAAYGLRMTRKLCPYPQKAVYKKGRVSAGKDAYKNFDCK